MPGSSLGGRELDNISIAFRTAFSMTAKAARNEENAP
jgi:hypothetical protein